ncbi:hypothetical protein EC950183_2110, partial [Escherichia coli 95.0183]
GILK